MRKLVMTSLLALALAACGGGDATPTLVPPTPEPPPPTATPAPLELLDAELLTARGATVTCDQGQGAEIVCTNNAGAAQIRVNSNASTYTRWTLKLGDVSTPLTGNETLAIHARRAGELTPNLYLAESDGDRIPVSLTRFGLGEAWGDVVIPLREIKDDAGNRPDFANIAEIQVVFEWADMRGVVELDSMRFVPAWEAEVAVAPAAETLAAALVVPEGFTVTAIADRLREMTQIEFTPEGDMLVSMQNGRIWRYIDSDGDGAYDRRRLYDSGYVEVVGVLADPNDGAIWIGGRGQLYRTLDSDGDGAADVRELRIDGMPWGRHQNNGLEWNPDPDPFTGEPGASWIYFGLGSTEDLEVGGDYNATVLRFPRDGQGVEKLEIVSRGIRNAYDVIWAAMPEELDKPDGPSKWQLFASENGPDFNDAPDEVVHVRWGLDFGFPDHFGMVEAPDVEGQPYSSPIYPVTPHTSADGLAYITNPAWPLEYRTLYVALFGEVFSPGRVGHTVERISLEEVAAPDGTTYRGEPSDFITGLDRPLPLAVAPDGNLLVGDYATGVIYHISYAGE